MVTPPLSPPNAEGNPVRNLDRAAGEIANVIETRALAMDLRRQGKSYPEIAAELGISVHSARGHVTAELNALRHYTIEDAHEVREVEIQRIDKMLQGIWGAAEDGDPDAIATVLKLMERRAKMLGLDAPVVKENHNLNATPEDLAKLSDVELFQKARELTGKMKRVALPDITATAVDPDAD
jgi:hypothetical protein